MLALHDIAEIEVGDVFHYEKSNHLDLFEKELNAVSKIFGLLDSPQKDELLTLWTEYEKSETPEAKYAAAIDRLLPLIMNFGNDGGTWLKNNVSLQMVLTKNHHIEDGAQDLWHVAKILLNESLANGFIHQE